MNSDVEVVDFRTEEEVPTTKTMFGEEVMVPEFCYSSCDRCDNSGYVNETTLMTADEHGREVICQECSQS